MAKRGRPKRGEQRDYFVKDVRVGLYIMPQTRDRLNWFAGRLGDVSQDIALAAALDSVGVPRDIEQTQVPA